MNVAHVWAVKVSVPPLRLVVSRISTASLAQASEKRVTTAEERRTSLRGELRRLHGEIAELTAKLSDADLAFLEPR